MQAAFTLVKGRRIYAMDHLAYREFERWVADRIMKRRRLRDVSHPDAERREKSSWRYPGQGRGGVADGARLPPEFRDL